MAARVELLVSAAQPVALLERLGPMALSATAAMQAMAELAAQVLQALMEQPCLKMVALAG